MSADRSAWPAAAEAGPSPRVHLARLAWEAALAADGVAGGDAGRPPRWQTEDRGEVLPGVVATARPDARFDVQLHLIASWPPPPLHELATTIRGRVVEAAASAGLARALGAQAIFFGDVAEPPPEALS